MRHVLKLIMGLLCVVPTVNAIATEVPIFQIGQKFSESAIRVHVGDTVVFTNKDNDKYYINAMSPSGMMDDKGEQLPGGVIKQIFAESGEYNIRCRIHPQMRMVVSVDE